MFKQLANTIIIVFIAGLVSAQPFLESQNPFTQLMKIDKTKLTKKKDSLLYTNAVGTKIALFVKKDKLNKLRVFDYQNTRIDSGTFMDGDGTTYLPIGTNSELYLKATFKNGVLNDTSFVYLLKEDGVKLISKHYFNNGVLDGDIFYYSQFSDKVISKLEYSKGVLQQTTTYGFFSFKFPIAGAFQTKLTQQNTVNKYRNGKMYESICYNKKGKPIIKCKKPAI